MSEAELHIDKFCADPERALLYAKEAIVLSLACRLSEEMFARNVEAFPTARKAGVSSDNIAAFLEGLEQAPHTTLAVVARLFWALDLVVEITVKPLPGKSEPMVRTEEDFRRLWANLAESGCCDEAEYPSIRQAWHSLTIGRGRDLTFREASDLVRCLSRNGQ